MNLFELIGTFFGVLFENLVYRPQLNLLEFYFRVTGDIGMAIILVGISVNLLLWPLVLSNYITSYKMKVLAPEIKKIQDSHKSPKDATAAQTLENGQKMALAMKEFNKKHKVNNAVMFQILFMQLFFGSGLFYIIGDIAKMDGKLNGLYQWIFGQNTTNFPKTSFQILQIDLTSYNYLWLPILIFLTSVVYGYYSFKISPQIKLPFFDQMKAERIAQKDKDKLAKTQKPIEKYEKVIDEEPIFDAAAFQKTQVWNMILLAPLMSFFFNIGLSTGLNIYFLALNVFNLVRQIIITQFYHDHINLLANQIYEQIKAENESEPVKIEL